MPAEHELPRFMSHPDGRWAVRYLDGADWHAYDSRGRYLGPLQSHEGWAGPEGARPQAARLLSAAALWDATREATPAPEAGGQP